MIVSCIIPKLYRFRIICKLHRYYVYSDVLNSLKFWFTLDIVFNIDKRLIWIPLLGTMHHIFYGPLKWSLLLHFSLNLYITFIFQITYYTLSLTSGYKIIINGEEKGRCLTSQRVPSVKSLMRVESPVPCSLTIVEHIPANGTITIKGLYRNRSILTIPTASFWGLTKL